MCLLEQIKKLERYKYFSGLRKKSLKIEWTRERDKYGGWRMREAGRGEREREERENKSEGEGDREEERKKMCLQVIATHIHSHIRITHLLVNLHTFSLVDNMDMNTRKKKV